VLLDHVLDLLLEPVRVFDLVLQLNLLFIFELVDVLGVLLDHILVLLFKLFGLIFLFSLQLLVPVRIRLNLITVVLSPPF